MRFIQRASGPEKSVFARVRNVFAGERKAYVGAKKEFMHSDIRFVHGEAYWSVSPADDACVS